MADSKTTAPELTEGFQIKRLPIEYDQKINVLLNGILYNATQAKAMCFVTDTMGNISATAKNVIITLRDAIIGGTEGSIIQDFVDEDSGANFAVLSDDGFTLEIYRPYYIRYKQVAMLKIVEDFDLTEIRALDTESTELTDSDWINAFNNLIEAVGNNQRGF